jgi:hypothetical protein
MTQGQPPSPDRPRPWFYQNWFLFAAFILGWPILAGLFRLPLVLWPVWPVLIIRSPWHTGFRIRALAWTMLLTGGGTMVELLQTPDTRQIALIIVIPGISLTVLTQALWTRYKMDLAALAQPPAPPETPAEAAPAAPLRPRPRPRRRSQRRRGSRLGRTPRNPS